MKRDPKPFLKGPPVMWHCTPLSTWLMLPACDYNRARIKEAMQSKGANDTEAMSARIQLGECHNCPGVLVLFGRGEEPEPKQIQPLAQLITNPPVAHGMRPIKSINPMLNRDNPLSRAKTFNLAPEIPKDEDPLELPFEPRSVSRRKSGVPVRSEPVEKPIVPPRPTDRDTTLLTDRRYVIYFERCAGTRGGRVRFSTYTTNWDEAIAIRDAFEATGVKPSLSRRAAA